jgi:hypothetical protein
VALEGSNPCPDGLPKVPARAAGHAHHDRMRSHQHRRTTEPSPSARPSRPRVTGYETILWLQRTVGNAAVARMIQGPVVQRDGTGLAGKKASKTYAKRVAKTRTGWDALTVLKRIDALLEPANEQLAKVGVPRVVGLVDPLGTMRGTADHAAFNRGLWQVWFNPDQLGPGVGEAQFARVANTVYHECRHAEQTFRVARKLATDGLEADEIATAISIPVPTARQAVDDPLPRKSKQEWAEASAWQYNMEVVEGTQSRADLVNARKDTAMAEYDDARTVWRALRKLHDNDPTVSPVLKKWYDDELLKPGGAGRFKHTFDTARSEYIAKRERAKQAYLQYAQMPVEEDAWATGGLIQAHLGLDPSTAQEELANLDAEERTMTPVVLLALGSGSLKEQQLLSAIQQLL